MKAVSEYFIGNTAVKIIDTGRRIRVIDVEKRQDQKQFRKTVIAIVLAAIFSFATSLSVVNYHNSQSILDRQNYSLKSEIDSLERENKILEKNNEEREKLSYKKIYKRATAMGMHFPNHKQVETYIYKKGSAIRLYQAP